MNAVSSNRWLSSSSSFSSAVKYTIGNEVVLMKKKKICFCNSMVGSKKKLLVFSNKTMGISCKGNTTTTSTTTTAATTKIRKNLDITTTTTSNESNDDKMEEYNTEMKRMMRNPYEYHHDLGMNYTLIVDTLIVGSQPQKPEDINHLKEEQNVAYILNLQQDKDVEFWGIDLQPIIKRCKELSIRHMRRPAKDFDPSSLRNGLPKAVSSLEWAITEGKGRVYVHCTAGLGRAPAVAIAYMFWFCGMDLNTAYDTLTSRRPCGPNRDAIRGATYDLAKNDPWKEPFENLPGHAFEDIANWERKLIQDRVRSLRGT